MFFMIKSGLAHITYNELKAMPSSVRQWFITREIKLRQSKEEADQEVRRNKLVAAGKNK